MKATPLFVGSALLCTVATSVHAASIIRDPNPPKYKLEIEPHLGAQYLYASTYGGRGFGPGARFAIPIVSPGFIKRLNNSVAISFGGDLLYLRPSGARFCDSSGCVEPANGLWALYAPATMQWNFWLTDKWSVFGEPGVVLRSPVAGCERKWGCKEAEGPIWWAFYAGARYHFSDEMALTLRAGYPTGVSVGLSIF
jgi:hypothetical protein